MSSFYDDASLVVIPSGYKTSKVYAEKPTDGSGDLAFTRTGDTATRVNSAGLIERVRTNVILQSNTFNTTWLPTSATITSGATDPNGGTTAWTLANTAASGIIQQAATLTGLRSVSIYAKQGTHRYLYMGAYGTTDSYQVFDLQTGTISTGTKGLIEAIGGGWYRCTSFGTDGITGGVQIFPSNNSLGAGTTNGNILIWRCQYESGDIATSYIPTTTAAVSVGPVANVPRLDYLGSTCPRLILEPQRVNLVTFSEQLDNAAWVKEQVSITANATTSPDGTANADKIIANATAGDKYVAQIFTLGIGTAYTTSAYFKSSEYTFAYIRFGGLVSNPYVIYNLATQAVVTTTGLTSSSITSVGNGWYRITATATTTTTTLAPVFMVLPSTGYTLGLDNIPEFTGNGTSGGFLWGAQLEAGAYATSYIPTLAASATRGADACSKTGISSLIGQTQGTLFVDFNWQQKDGVFFVNSISDGTTDNEIMMAFGSSADNRLRFSIASGGTVYVSFDSATLASGTYKVAFAYANNDAVAYINGVQQFTDSSVTIPATSAFKFLRANDTLGFVGSINQQLLFKTRLTNAELAELTTL